MSCYERWWWHSKPVARSLQILDNLGALESESGRSDGDPGFLPFCVTILRTDLTPGVPGEPPATGRTFLVCARRELHAVAAEAQRLADLAKGGE